MFINAHIVAIAFRLINFAALMGIIFFVFKKYNVNLLALISRKENMHQDLLAQQKNLEIQQHDLNALMKKETIQCQNFKSKVDEWKKTVHIENSKKEEEHHKLLVYVKAYRTHIASQKEAQRIQKDTLAAALTTMNTALSDHFKKPHAGTDYLNTVIQFMNERAS